MIYLKIFIVLIYLFDLNDCFRIKHSINHDDFLKMANNDKTIYNDQAVKLIHFLSSQIKTRSTMSANNTTTTSSRTLATNTNLSITTLKYMLNTITNIYLTTTRSTSTTTSTITSLNKNSDKYESIINKINETHLIHNKKLIDCLNCSELKDNSECDQFEDYDMHQLVNVFCCECNPYK